MLRLGGTPEPIRWTRSDDFAIPNLMIKHTIHEHWLDGLHGPMRYWQSEPNHGLPVVFVHGYGAMIEHWQAIARPIAREHTFIALDLYYFGKSKIPSRRPERQIWADQIAELIAVTCSEPPIVVGHSMGGMAAVQLAQDYPHFVRGLVLVASTGISYPGFQPSPLDQALFGVTSAPMIGEMITGVVANRIGVSRFLSTAYYNQKQVTRHLINQFTRPLQRAGGQQAYLSVTRVFPELYLDTERGPLDIPALLIWGKHDRSVPVELATQFKQQLLPQAQIAIMPGTAHCPFDEAPQQFCNVLLPWLNQVRNDSTGSTDVAKLTPPAL
jgi:pimeloyl-ACP methyl ester carboxylesterase